MATELGQAYVQIMPSAKGISGSIQKAINPEATAAGKGAGTRIASSISKTMGNVGSTLTKAITLPVAGAATAVAGLVGALGFKRLVGLDTAQAKLKGLGYDAQAVERISEQVETAIMGGMTTMGEGVSIAAGGLAAGVKEGAELERYIKLVGDAAVGANRPVDEMAQIFNRVQGGGRLMTQELNMIEMGLPGFAQAMADELAGGSLETFREMVTNGEVGSKEFLNVMDDFAGGMAGAYSESWEGMAKNTLAYVGIIGESLLEGLFEDGKKGLANLIEVLQSDAVMDWAQQTGEKIREVASNIVDVAKDVIGWWNDLSGGAKKAIGIFAGIAVVIGPIMLVVAKIISTIITLIPLFKAIGAAIAFLTSPIGLVIAAIIAAVALIYIYWEPISEFFIGIWNAIKDAGLEIWENLKEGWANAVEVLKETWQSVTEFFSGLMESIVNIFTAWQERVIENWNTVLEGVKEIISAAYEWLNEKTNGVFGQYVEIIKSYLQTAADIVQAIWTYIKETFSNFMDFIKALVKGDFQGMKDAMKAQMETAKNLLKNIWEAIKSNIGAKMSEIFSNVKERFTSVKSTISNLMNATKATLSAIWNGIKSAISNSISAIRSAISSGFNAARNVVSNITNSIRSTVSNIFNSLRGIVSGAMSGVRGAISSGMSSALSVMTGMISRFYNAGKNIVTSIADGIKGAIGKVTGAIGDVASKVRNFLPFSPAKEGPLMDIMDVKWGETIGGGIEKGEGAVAKAMENILDFDLPQKARFHNPNKTDYDKNNDGLSQQKQPIIMQVDGKRFAQVTGDYTSAEGGKRIRRIERGLA